MLLRAVAAQGWDPLKDVNIIAQAPEVAGSALQAGKIDAHADFVPFAELFPNRGFARKIYDGSQSGAATMHGALVDESYARQYPDVVVAYLRAGIEASQLLAAEPEKYSELIEKVTGVEAEVNYLFHGPLGVQTRDQTWKPEYRQAVGTAIDTLKLLKKADRGLDLNTFIDDQYIRAAYKASGLDYSAQLANYAQTPLKADDALTGKPITDFARVAQIWVKGEPKVRHYASAENAFTALQALKKDGKEIRAVYAQAEDSGMKLLANQAWFASDAQGRLSAFLLKGQAQRFAETQGGKVLDFNDASAQAAVASR
jgi:NitT/TauT family transport system substrate-binding protein